MVSKTFLTTTKFCTYIRLTLKGNVSCTEAWVPNSPLTWGLWQPAGDNSFTPCGSAQHSEQPGLVGGAPAHSRGAGTRWSLISHPTQAILWICDSRAHPDRSGDKTNPKQLLCIKIQCHICSSLCNLLWHCHPCQKVEFSSLSGLRV